MLRLLLSALLSVCCLVVQTQNPPDSITSNNKLVAEDLTIYVNPFVGTAGHGHTFPGATLPFGMVQLSPDTRLTGWDGCSGYHYSDNAIYGFSHTHLSGTGISDYGDILFMPTLERGLREAGQYSRSFSHKHETASPGYYSVKLDDRITVELTATSRAGFHRYIFPAGSDHGEVLLDLKHRDRVLESYLRIVDTTHIEGFRRSTAWAKNQVVYFVAEFSEGFATVETSAGSNEKSEWRGNDLKAAFRFENPGSILLKVGISSVSIDGARRNLESEIGNWDFDKIKRDASAAWNRELSKIQVSGGTKDQLTTFYTALYHAELAPNLFMDVDRSYLGRDFKIHKAEGFENYSVFSLWDTFRAAHPLYTIIIENALPTSSKRFSLSIDKGDDCLFGNLLQMRPTR